VALMCLGSYSFGGKHKKKNPTLVAPSEKKGRGEKSWSEDRNASHNVDRRSLPSFKEENRSSHELTRGKGIFS